MRTISKLALALVLAALPAGVSAAGSHTTPCYTDTSGKHVVVDSGCTLEVKSGGKLTLDSGSTETNSSTPATATPSLPGGRLTLSSTLPIMTADVSAGTTVYYLPYASQTVPTYNGTAWNRLDITSAGINFALGATNMPTTQVYDIYAVNVAGTPTLCSMYWGANTSRSSSAGGKSGSADARVVQLNGIWVNKTAIGATDCYGGASGTTAVAIPANQGTMLGSYYTNGSAQTAFVCKPTAGSGGAADVIGISNAYNRVPVSCSNRDTATSVTSSSASWAALGASDNTIFLDSLQQVPFSTDAHVVAGNGTINNVVAFGVACAGTGTTAPTVIGGNAAPTGTLADNYQDIATHEGFYPALGLTTCFAEKQSPSATSATYMPTTTYEDFTLNGAY